MSFNDKGLVRVKSAKPPAQLVANAKLSDYRIKRIIRCYAEGLPVSDVMTRCRVSHVTAYRLYGQLRSRLLHVGLFKTYEQFGAEKDEDEEEGSYFPWEQFKAYLERQLNQHRGIRSGNRNLYVAEKLFKHEAKYNPAQFYSLILLAIRLTGPLNRPPRPFDSAKFHREVLRIILSDIRKSFAELDLNPAAKTRLTSKARRLQWETEDLMDQLHAILRKSTTKGS